MLLQKKNKQFFNIFISMRLKFLSAFLVLIFVAIPLLSFLFINKMENEKKQFLSTRAKQLHNYFSTVARQALAENSFTFLQSLAEELASRDPEMILLLVSLHNGQIISSSRKKEMPYFSSLRENSKGTEIYSMIQNKKEQFFFDDAKKRFISLSILHRPDNIESGSLYIYIEFTTLPLHADIKKLWFFSISIAIGFLITGTIFSFIMSKRMSQPIYRLANKVRLIAEGELDSPVASTTKDELGILAKNIEVMRINIKNLTKGLEKKVQERTKKLDETNEKLAHAMAALWGEMKLAKKIQSSMLPGPYTGKNYEILADIEPAMEVGGDYYDIITSEERLWILIGDVSGHGVPAGLFMMMVQTAVRSLIKNDPSIQTDQLLIVVNDILWNNLTSLKEERYMSIIAFKEENPGVFSYSGLHQDLLIYRKQEKQVEIVESFGMWVGLEPDISHHTPKKQIFLAPGDTLLLFTDGLTEATLPDGSLYEQEQLIKVLSQNGEKSLTEIRAQILKSLNNYEKRDDVTLVIVRRY